LSFALTRHLPLDILKSVAPFSVEIGMLKGPRLVTTWSGLGVLDFVEVILVQLTDKTGNFLMFKHFWEYRLGKLVHIFDNEAVAFWTPRNDRMKGRVLKHFEELLNKV
jgi:hypothetical protein